MRLVAVREGFDVSDAGWGRDQPLKAKPGAVFGDDEGDPSLRVDVPLPKSAVPAPPPPPDPGQRVDSLFTEAIERQVAEQRNLNRLLQDIERSISDVRGRVDELQTQVAREVGPTFDRLAAVDAAVTSLRENSASQTVALRAEMQEMLEGIRSELHSSSERQDEEFSAVRGLESQLVERLANVSRAVDGVTERLTSRQDAFGQDVQRLISRVTDIGESAEDTRDLLGPQATRFEEAVNGMVERIQSVVDRQLERMEKVEARWDGIEAAIDKRLVTLRDEVAKVTSGGFDELRRKVAEDVAEQVKGPIDGLREQQTMSLQQMRDAQANHARDANEAQQRALEQLRGSQDAAFEEVAAKQQRLLEGLAEQVRTAAAGVAAEVGEIESVAARMNQARMLDEDSRGVLRNELLEDLRVANDVTLGKLRDRIEDGFAALRDRVVQQLGELDERVASSQEELTAFGTSQEERLGVVSVDVQSFGERVDTVVTEVERQSRILGGVTEDIGTMGETLGQVLGEMQARILAAQEAGLVDVKSALEDAELRLVRSRELFDRAAAQVEGATGTLGEQLSEALAEVARDARDQSAETVSEISAAADRLARTSESVRALEGSMVEYLQARDRRYEEQRMAVLGDLVRQLGDHLSRRDRKRIAEQIDIGQAAAAAPPAPLIPAPRRAASAFAPPAALDAIAEPAPIEAAVEAEVEDLTAEEPVVERSVIRKGRTASTKTRSPKHDRVRELEALTKAALYERAKEREIPGRSGMSREDLIEALAQYEA